MSDRFTTFKGGPLKLAGPELKVGDKAPDFALTAKDLSTKTLGEGGTVRIFSVVPSLDTPVCDAQTKRFNDEITKLEGVEVITVSMDLPFAQGRWCNAFGVDHVTMLSDHKNASFGSNWGTLIEDWRVESRAIFVVGKDNTLVHVEYVGEVAEHPNYEAAVAAAHAAL